MQQQGVRRTERLRYMRVDDRELATSGKELHYLFPAPAYKAVTEREGNESPACHACSIPLPTAARDRNLVTPKEGLSPYGRYRCPICKHAFDADCALFVQDVLHVCPGCG